MQLTGCKELAVEVESDGEHLTLHVAVRQQLIVRCEVVLRVDPPNASRTCKKSGVRFESSQAIVAHLTYLVDRSIVC